MNPESTEPREALTLGVREDQTAADTNRSAASIAQGDPPRVAGRLDTYRSRNRHWHGQVRVEKCPGCGHPHLHRAPMAQVPDVLKNAPCGLAYVVVLRTEAEAA